MIKYCLPHFRVLSTLLLLLLSTTLTAKPQDASASVSATQAQSKAAVEILKNLTARHYASQVFGDGLSSRLLDNYLTRLDSNRSILLQSDISEFNQYRFTLDDHLKKGDLNPGFVIFNRYQQRLIARLQYTIDQLPNIVANMDFTKAETLIIDRSEEQWPANQQEADDLWRKRIKSRVISLRMDEKPEDEIISVLKKRYTNQLNRVKQSNAEDTFQVFINSLTTLYDPHTNYFSPANTENFNINMSLSLEGIGAVLQTEDEYTKVVRLVHAGPADKQGELQPSDRIIAVAQGENGEFQDVIGMRLDEVVKLIRGPKGSIVRLEVIPVDAKSDDEHKTIEIVRNTVKLEEQSAQKEILEIPNGDRLIKVGVIDIPAFYIDFAAMRSGDSNYKSTTRDVKRLLDELIAEGVEGIIIDLRENGGGSLQEASSLTGLFIEYGPIVQLQHSSTQKYQEAKRRKTDFYTGPLVVLVNRLSASASEIFAGAIQDYQRGIIVGSQSFGKGTVQSLTPLRHGQLKITESKFYRISGDSTQHRGIVPDIQFPAFYDVEKVGESSLDHALSWGRIDSIPHRRYYKMSAALPELLSKSQQRTSTDPDFIFLRDRYGLLEEARNVKTVPLSEKERAALEQREEQQWLDIENKRRLAKGLEPFKTLDEKDDSEQAAAADTKINENDPLLTEAANILVDSMPIYLQQQYAVGNAMK